MEIGIDFWGTLAEANPLFVKEKKKLFKKFNISNGFKIMSQIKKDINFAVEQVGYQPTEKELTLIIKAAMKLSDYEQAFNFIHAYRKKAIQTGLNYYEESKKLIDFLKEKGNVTILSNTMFLSSEYLKPTVEKHFGVVFVGSDELCSSKPLVKDFNNKLKSFDLFIGDNLKTDGKYAKNINSKYIQVKDGNYDKIYEKFVLQTRI